MPNCKNNSKKTYKGDEPSPKGLGFCASVEKEGKEMKGKDGNMWVKKNGKWIKKILKINITKKYLINYTNGGCHYHKEIL
jgi:hypothetical protein